MPLGIKKGVTLRDTQGLLRTMGAQCPLKYLRKIPYIIIHITEHDTKLSYQLKSIGLHQRCCSCKLRGVSRRQIPLLWCPFAVYLCNSAVSSGLAGGLIYPDPREDPKSRSRNGVPIKYPVVARVPN